jgi:hypothetical protein
MSKEQISKHDLQRMALQDIRSYPGCEYVKDIQIEYKVDRVQKTNWIMHVFTREGANMVQVQIAINATRRRLMHRYELRTES